MLLDADADGLIDGDELADTDADGLTEADGLRDSDALLDADDDGLIDADGLRDAETELDGLRDADGLTDPEPGRTASSGASPMAVRVVALADCTTSVSHNTRATLLLSVFATRRFQPAWAAPIPLLP